MTGDTDNGLIFAPQYVYSAEPGEGGVKHLSFSTAMSGGAYLEANLLAGSKSEKVFKSEMFSISANGYPSFFGEGVYTKKLMQNKWYLVDILMNSETNTAELYIDGELMANADLPSYPSNALTGVVFIKNGWETVYLDDIALTADNNDPSVTFMSDSPYYANTISYVSGTVDVYSQSRERFMQKLRLEGASDAVMLNADGTANTDSAMSANKYLRITTDEDKSIYYFTKEGSDSYLSSLDSIDISNDAARDTENFYIYEQPNIEKLKGSALDMSFALDAPAGKYGFVKRDGDKFVLSNTNDEIKFWGTNISDQNIFLEHDEAEKVADRIAQMGFNIVRIHKFDSVDSERGLLKTNPDTGKVELDADKMDKLCYLLAELKERGIYWYINLYVSRPICPGDNADYHDTAQMLPAGYWNRSLIDIQNEFANQVLGYDNPYTGMRIADDPALALVDMNNEKNIYTGNMTPSTGSYYNELNEKFSAWLKNKYKDRAALKSAWLPRTNDEKSWCNFGLQESEDPWSEGKPAQIMDDKGDGSLDRGRFTKGRGKDVKTFLCELEADYYSQRMNFLKNTVGVKCPVSGGTAYTSNQIENFYAMTNTDFVSTHLYWGGGDVNLKTVGKQFDGRSQLETDSLGIITEAASTNIYGMPHTVDEWNHCVPNAYTAEGPILASAYSRLNNLNFFAFSFDTKTYLKTQTGGEDISLDSPYSIAENPVSAAVFPAAAVMFQRGDIKESQSGYYESISQSEIGEAFDKDKGIWPGIHFLPSYKNHLGLIGKTGSVFNISGLNDGLANDSTVKTTAEAADSGNKKYVSATNELTTDLNNKIFTADTAGSQAVCGFIGGKTISLSNADIKVNNDYAAVSLTSVDKNNGNISGAEKLLLTLAGETRNYAQIVETDSAMGKQKSIIKVAGKAPIMAEQITGEITLKLDGDYTVYPLTSSGERKAPLAVTKTSGGFKFSVAKDTKAMNFEIVKN